MQNSREEDLGADERFFLGIDGGATRCRARLRDSAGAVLAEAAGPAANIYVDYVSAVDVVRNAISEIFRAAPLAIPAALGLGLAGLSTGGEADRIIADLSALGGIASVRAANDVVVACLGAHAGADGGLIIAGTGSNSMARVGGRETVIGGRGFLVGDDGSAARIGADAVRAAVRAADGLGPATPLTQGVLQKFSDDVHRIEVWALTAKSPDYGALAPMVLEAAGQGDAVALPIVAAAAAAIDAMYRAVRAQGAPAVALVGGLSESIRPYLQPELDAALMRPLFDATDGAILLAGGVLPASPLKSCAP
jgi:glucosamine kinase